MRGIAIVLEARITLDAPGDGDLPCGMATLTSPQMATSRPLADADRRRESLDSQA